VSLDFVEGLPISHGYNYILVVVDLFTKYSHFLALNLFTKYSHFLALKYPFSALSIAKIFMQHIYKLHGLPFALVSDRDRILTNQLWKELFRLAGVDLRLCSAYHLQFDGQTERVNQCMEQYLRYFVTAVPNKWFDWLHLAEFWYNTSWHSALNQSPFQVLYGHNPRKLGIDASSTCSVDTLEEWMQQKDEMQTLIQHHLGRAKNRMKLQADKNRTERSFHSGNLGLYQTTAICSKFFGSKS
jgi:hypothetical protein